jgi:hypothetical protein
VSLVLVTLFSAIALGAISSRADAVLFVADRADSIAVNGGTLFWKTDCGGELDPPTSRLKGIPTTGGTTTTFYSSPTCDGGRVSGDQVAVDATDVYYLSGDGRVMRVSRSRAAAVQVSTMNSSATTTGCCSIAVFGSNVFWSEGSAIYEAPKLGGSRTLYTLVFTSGTIHSLRAAPDGSLLFIKGNQLRRVRPDLNQDLVAPGVAEFAIGGRRLFYDQIPATGDQQLVSRRASDLGDLHVLRTIGRAISVNGMAADGTNVYWHEVDNLSGGPVMRLPAGGGTADALTGYFGIFAGQLVTDGTFVFFSNNNGVYRVATGAPTAPPPGDVWVTGIEATQGVQTADNLVPLVGCKRTAVRVYVQGSADGNGPWSDVTATLSGAVSHSPVNRSTITVSLTGSDRTTSRDSFTFVLDPNEVSPGLHTFSVLLRLPSGRAESDTSNDAFSQTFNFGPCISNGTGAPVVYGAVFANRGIGTDPGPTVPAAPWSDLELHRQFVENTYPLSSFHLTPLPSIGEGSAGTFDNLDAERTWANQELGRLPAGTLLNSLLNWGTANGYAAGRRSEEENGRDGGSVPGSTMAQEVGHTLGSWWHTFDGCGNTNPQVYPRCDSSIASTGFKTTTFAIPPLDGPPFEGGIEPIPPSTSLGTTVDYMGYVFTPNWSSVFTYCTLMRHLGSQLCPSTVEGGGSGGIGSPHRAAGRMAPGGTDARFVYVSGLINNDGTATLNPVEEILRPFDATSYVPGTTYGLAIDGQDGSSQHIGFDLLDSEHDTVRPRQFSLVVPFEAGVQRIRLLQGKTLLAKRSASPNAPTVKLLFPVGGETLTGEQTVSWSGSDADGGALRYSVEYSPDLGKTWLPVVVGTAKSSAIVNFDNLPGSQQASLRVEVTDGLNTSNALTAGTFIVPPKAPEVRIDQPGGGKAAITTKDVLFAEGSAFDWEDGNLNDPAAYRWLLDGKPIGTGPWIAQRFRKGTHTLTLEATDSSNASGQDSITLEVT